MNKYVIYLEFISMWYDAAICRSLINASFFVYTSSDDTVDCEQNFTI